jgi:hypothetical protein
MKPKLKVQLRKKRVAPSKTKSAKAKKVSARDTGVSPSQKEFAELIWPGIKDSTRFVAVPEFQGTVTYALPSGESFTATLKWYTVSHGSRILGHYDDENDVCYVGEFIEG